MVMREQKSKWGGHKYNILREEIGFIPCEFLKVIALQCKNAPFKTISHLKTLLLIIIQNFSESRKCAVCSIFQKDINIEKCRAYAKQANM